MQERRDYRTKCYCAKKPCVCHIQWTSKKKPDNMITRSRGSMENKNGKSNYEWVKIKHEYDNYCPTTETSNLNSSNSSQKRGQANSMGSRRSSTTTVSSSSGVTYCTCSKTLNSTSSSSSSSSSSSNKCKFGELNKLKYSNQRSYYENLRKQSEQQLVDLGVAGAVNLVKKRNIQLDDKMRPMTVKPRNIYDRAYVRSLQEFRLRNRKECFFYSE